VNKPVNKYVLRNSYIKKPAKIDYERQLNPEQYRVVTEGDGASLVLAGAGSGKTRTLIYRVAYLLERNIKPENILLVTFTNKAARVMLNRVESLLKYRPRKLWGGTFHHIGNLCLRQYASSLGYNEDFGILDREDSRCLINSCIQELKINTTERRFPRAAVVEGMVNLATNSKVSIAEIIQSRYPYFEEFIPEVEKIKESYIRHKKSSNNMDYDDLLTEWIKLLESVSQARKRYCEQFKYILVDEYQDTNRLQNKIIQILSSYHRNILVVGDDAQSIYSFRAADIKNILDFPKTFPDTKIFKLETNYRSSPEILDLANETISNNINQYPKRLRNVQPKGEIPKLVHLQDRSQEAQFVSQRVLELREQGVAMNEIAVLFRARYQAVDLELELTKRDIPYVIRGGISFFEQAHIKDVLAYLRIVVNPKDELSWRRALQLQPGIGPNFTDRIWSKLASSPNPLNRVLSGSLRIGLSTRAKAGWRNFLKAISFIAQPDMLFKPAKAIGAILEKGYERYVQISFEDSQDRLEELHQLANFASAYSSLKKFLRDVTLREGFKGETLRVAREDDEYIILSTIHQAKGLEWQVVMLTGLSEGQFPHPKSIGNLAALEEERRLFYVAITRAKRDLYLTHPIMKFDYNQGQIISRPSRFIQELSSAYYEEWKIEEPEGEIILDYTTENSQW
jgi:DNA helicase-2/ATP-dependent DNA helicase PcrA